MKNPSQADLELVRCAFLFAQKIHENQKRFSGESYFTHPFEVAKILADFRADAETIAAGLLHDTIEESNLTLEEIEKEFGKKVAFLVDGVTKLGKLKYRGLTRHVESLRKLFVAMAEDIRVIIIRLADRLHNVKTLEHVPPEKQYRIALETLEIYAPIANRLGMWKIKGMLEDASFPYVYPDEYKEVMALRKTKGKESVKRLQKIAKSLQKSLAESHINDYEIDYRIKYLYSLYMKLRRCHMDIDQIYDISALRVIVPTISDCYQILGTVHRLWRPAPGRLKDYIANPKPNGYQSIHTAIFTGDGSIVEIQIRTKEMQNEAEYGVASHVLYKEKSWAGKSAPDISSKVRWIYDLIEWQKEVQGSDEFLHGLKTDFFQDLIFVFTPKGDVIELPAGATALDFAYAIHSSIGDRAAGAKINGKFVALDTILKNRDRVEIETKKTGQPSAKWLEFVKTSLARRHIRNVLSQQRKSVRALFGFKR